MKLKCTRGFGKVEGPDGEDIDVEDTFDVDSETADYLLNNYPGMEVVEDDSDTDKSGGSTGEDTDAEPECGVNGCSRTVDSLEATCWQH